jgi:hypothetical protein
LSASDGVAPLVDVDRLFANAASPTVGLVFIQNRFDALPIEFTLLLAVGLNRDGPFSMETFWQK